MMSSTDADNAGVKFPPPAALLLVIFICWVAEPEPHFPAPPFFFLGIAIAVAGFVLGFSGIRRFFAFGVHPSPLRPVSRLVTGGPYRFTRNPMYLGIEIMLIGVALTLGSYAFLVGALVMFLYFSFYVIPREETYMTRKFGAEYTEFCARVRRWI